jgi:predicted dehydrogenase
MAGLAAVGAGAARAQSSVADMKFAPTPNVRIGVIGVGGRGNSLIDNFSAVPGVRIRALCDVVEEKVKRAQARLERTGKAPQPIALYSSGERAFEEMVRREDLDLVIVATPWVWHAPMAVAAMKAGRHVGVEVPAARTLDECWQLVRASEASRRHCIQLENCCYGYNEMMVLNMVRAGLFGEITHGAGAYNHDLHGILFSNEGEGLWRRFEHLDRNGNLYPMHGLGPVAHYMDVNRGDLFDSLVSMSSLSAGLQAYRKEKLRPDDPRNKEVYKEGDFNVSLIRTVRGRVIQLEHNVSSPQPYDRINLIAGTKGIFRDYPPRVYVDGSPKEEFGPLDPYKAKYEHPLWTRMGEIAKDLGGHGGMDFIMAYRLIECMKAGTAPDIDVYDAAAWSAAGPLSEASVAAGGAPQKFPDFTGGLWRSRPPV